MRRTTRDSGIWRREGLVPETVADWLDILRSNRADAVLVNLDRARALISEARSTPRLPPRALALADELEEKAAELQRHYAAERARPGVLAALEFSTRFYMLLFAVAGIDEAVLKHMKALDNLDRRKVSNADLLRALAAASSDAHAARILTLTGRPITRTSVLRRRRALGLPPPRHKK